MRYWTAQRKSMSWPSPVSSNNSSGDASFWNQVFAASAAPGAGPQPVRLGRDRDRRGLRARGGVVFDALHAILGDHVVRAERPGQAVVPAGCERRRDDLPEAQAQADFARPHREQPAGQVHRRGDRDAGDRSAAHRQPQTRHGRQIDRAARSIRPARACGGCWPASSRDQDECAGDLEPFRDERRGRAEGCARIHSQVRGRPN